MADFERKSAIKADPMPTRGLPHYWTADQVKIILESWPETDRIMARGYTPGNQG